MSDGIFIQPKDNEVTAQRSCVDSLIASLPGVHEEGPGVFAYGDKRRRLYMHIYLELVVFHKTHIDNEPSMAGFVGEPSN